MMIEMRVAVLLLFLLAGCGEQSKPPAGSPAKKTVSAGLRLECYRLPKEIEKVVLDGNAADDGWRRAKELSVPLVGEGPEKITIKAVYNDRYVYFLLLWSDAKIDRGNVCRFEEPGVWRTYEGEDALLLFFPPPELSREFRAGGFGTFVENGKFAHPGRKGFADAWYWGAQTTRPYLRARDHWLRPDQRLRGDSQPEQSDNVTNWSVEHEGPAGVPLRIRADSTWYLPESNVQALTPERILNMRKESNYGWTVPAIIQRPMAGSRADVFVSARHVGGVWVAEIARKLDTGHRDDLVLGMPGSTALMALGVYDGTAGGVRVGEYGQKAAVSAAIEISFLSGE